MASGLNILVDLANLVSNKQQEALLRQIALDLVATGEQIMGRLDSISQALTDAGSAAADEAAQVSAEIGDLKDQIAELQATVDNLSAGAVTDAEVAQIQEQVAGLTEGIKNILPDEPATPGPGEEPQVNPLT
jgi:uncharacterized phage infection (PIP) family protein YhgE